MLPAGSNPVDVGARRRSVHWLRVALLSGISLSAVAAHAQDATWVGGGAPDPTEWLQDNNWNPATAPTGTATFDVSAFTTVNSNGLVSLGAIDFLNTASAYTITMNDVFLLNGIGVTNNGAANQTINNTLILVFQNSASANNGTGPVTYNNSGTISFQSTATAGSATVNNNGDIEFNDTSTAGSALVTNNAVINFQDSSSAGNAIITNNATGIITFNSTSSAGNAVFAMSAGSTVAFGNNSNAGNAVFNNANGTTITFNDASSAGNSVINNGDGTVTFNNSSTAAASIINNVSGGTVTFNNNSTADASIINVSSAGTLTFNDLSSGGTTAILNAFNNGAIFFNGSASGGLASFNIGTGGRLDISGLSAAGTDAGSITGLGTVFLGAKILTVGANNQSTTFGGLISDGGVAGGTGGGINKVGTGTLTLPGVETYTGPTDISGGTLVVNGSIAASSTTVNSGGVLTGVGTVGNTNVTGGGIFAPGSGTPGSSMTVAGALTFAPGGIYQINLDPTTASFATVSGTASLGGGTVSAVWASGSYIQKQYSILTAGSVSGTFASIVNSNLPANFADTLGYDATHVFLNLAMFVPPSANTVNEQNVANALVNSFNTNGGIPGVFGGLTPAGLTQLSGELGASFAPAAFQAGNLFLNLMLDPFVDGRPEGSLSPPMAYASEPLAATNAFAAADRRPAASLERRYGIWGSAFGGSGNIDGNAVVGSHTTDTRIWGAAAGFDYRVTPDALLGIAVAGGSTRWSLDQGLGDGRSDMFQTGVYGKAHWGAAYIGAALAYSFHDVTTNRTVTIAGTDQLQASFRANMLSGRLEGGYRFALPAAGVTPYGAVQTQSIMLPSYGETAASGSPQFALNYSSQTTTTTRTELGVRFDRTFALDPGALMTVYSRVAWAHDFNNDASANAIFQTLPASNFIVNGAAPASDSALVTAGGVLKLADGWSVTAKFDGEFADNTSLYSGTAIVKKVW